MQNTTQEKQRLWLKMPVPLDQVLQWLHHHVGAHNCKEPYRTTIKSEKWSITSRVRQIKIIPGDGKLIKQLEIQSFGQCIEFESDVDVNIITQFALIWC